MEKQAMWQMRAVFCELLARGFRLPDAEMAEALASGEYAQACTEVVLATGLARSEAEEALAGFEPHQGSPSAEELLHVLRTEHTYLFTGLPEPKASPYAGVWWARQHGLQPLLFVNKRSMDIERFMRACGIGRPEGTNEPLDHIATIFEFLQYVSLCCSGDVRVPEGARVDEGTFATFVSEFLSDWTEAFGKAVVEQARLPIYGSQARMLGAFMRAAQKDAV